MLSARLDNVLKYVVRQYIEDATPVPSQRITKECGLGVSSATIRNDMAELEEQGYIIRPHTSAGAIPTDKGYRYYVDSLHNVMLPEMEQRMVSHLFHQVESKMEQWLALAAMLVARSAHNMAVVTLPKAADCRFRHIELISLNNTLALVVLVLRGIKIKKELLNFEQPVSQSELTTMANKLSDNYADLNRTQIHEKQLELSALEKQIRDCLTGMMQDEDESGDEEPYLEGWHFMLDQPEFAHNQKTLDLMELVEHRKLLQVMKVPPQKSGVQVVIGEENKAEIIRNCSVIVKQYGLPEEASGTVGLLGPTRMPYERAISTVDYLSKVLGALVNNLYGKNITGTGGEERE